MYSLLGGSMIKYDVWRTFIGCFQVHDDIQDIYAKSHEQLYKPMSKFPYLSRNLHRLVHLLRLSRFRTLFITLRPTKNFPTGRVFVKAILSHWKRNKYFFSKMTIWVIISSQDDALQLNIGSRSQSRRRLYDKTLHNRCTSNCPKDTKFDGYLKLSKRQGLTITFWN